MSGDHCWCKLSPVKTPTGWRLESKCQCDVQQKGTTKMQGELNRTLTASGSEPRYIQVRNWDKAQCVLDTLADCGFAISDRVRASAATGVNIGFKADRHSLDRVLANSTLKTHQRIALKLAADRLGLLGEAR